MHEIPPEDTSSPPPTSIDLDTTLVKALAHPLRLRILARLNEVVASPKELAKEFGVPLPRLSYHMRMLADMGAIELVSRTPRRGAIEHHYRALTRPFVSDEDWAKLPGSSRQAISQTALQDAFEDLSHAISEASFDSRPDRHLSFTRLQLDEPAWTELRQLLADTVERGRQLQEESTTRLEREAQSTDDTIPAALTMLFYPRPQG